MEENIRNDNFDDFKRRLKMVDELGLGRKLENIKDFKESFFRDNYYDAFFMTWKLVQSSRNNNRSRSDSFKSMSLERIYNIISFCGERGTGKTSVMDSFICALQGDKKEYTEFIEDYQNLGSEELVETGSNELSRLLDENRFVCLDEIDASLLEEKEDILDAVLSKMLKKFELKMKDKGEDYLYGARLKEYRFDKTSILRQFEDIYHKKSNLQMKMEKDPYLLGESSVELLNNLAGSLDIQDSIRNFIPYYLSAINDEEDNYEKNSHLVIIIDDLDMHGDVYKMLEQIHRYLMIPRVIVYIALSDSELHSVCKRHFMKNYDNAEDLTMSYLEKILPYSQRVYLPAPYSGDFFNMVSNDSANNVRLPVKDYLLRKIVRRTGIYYNGCGKETHFYEIGNLRTLYNVDRMLTSMSNLKSDGIGLIDRYYNKRDIIDYNIEKIRQDIIFRMAVKNLDDNQKMIFRGYYKEDVSKNGEYIVNKIDEIIEESNFEIRRLYGYSYGQFLHSLYSLEKANQNYVPLVQCVLALSSLELTQNSLYAFGGGDKKSKDKLNSFIGETIWGSWADDIFPYVVYCKDNSGEKTKVCKESLAYIKNHRFCKKVSVDLCKLGLDKNANSVEGRYNICLTLLENQFVETVELLMMFFTERKECVDRDEIINHIRLECKDDKIMINFNDWESSFDVMGFAIIAIKNILNDDFNNYFKEVDAIIFRAMKEFCFEGFDISNDDKNLEYKLQSFIKDHSMQQEYILWNDSYKGLVLPIYSTDIMYHIYKEAEKTMEKKYSKEINPKDFVNTIRRLYKVIGKCLEDEDQFYGNRENNTKIKEKIDENNRFFSIAYFKHPFIKRFFSVNGMLEDHNQTLPELFEKIIVAFVDSLSYADEL